MRATSAQRDENRLTRDDRRAAQQAMFDLLDRAPAASVADLAQEGTSALHLSRSLRSSEKQYLREIAAGVIAAWQPRSQRRQQVAR